MNTNTAKMVSTIAIWLSPAIACAFAPEAAIAFIGSLLATLFVWD